MVSPYLLAGIKQLYGAATFRINCRKIGAFVQIALITGEREVFSFVASKMLTSDDVLDLKPMLESMLWEAAILGSVAGSIADELASSGIHERGG